MSDFAYDLGFLGGGQLARMSIQAAQAMGLRCLSLDSGTDTPAGQLAASLNGALHDPEAVSLVIKSCRHVTLENEFIPADVIRQAVQRAGREESVIRPGIDTLATIQDKLTQRQAYAWAGVASPHAVAIDPADPGAAQAAIGFPMVLKARFGGYDGKGTRTARTPEEFESYRELWADGTWLAESFVPFRRELAVMVYRSEQGFGCFPTMETVQANHVCDLVFPSGVDASEIAMAAVESVAGFGLFGVELFEHQDGSFSVNEIAPRPHNTGHYTLDWGGISQFAQHVRLSLGLPPEPPVGQACTMANLMGQPGATDYRRGLRAAIEAVPSARVHWYGKAESRPGRKMGHLNVAGPDGTPQAKIAREAFYRAWASDEP